MNWWVSHVLALATVVACVWDVGLRLATVASYQRHVLARWRDTVDDSSTAVSRSSRFYSLSSRERIIPSSRQPQNHFDRSTTKQPVAQHLLDCDKGNSTCRYFYPVDFFERPGAWGYPYRVAAQRERMDNPDRLLTVNYIRYQHGGKMANASQGLPYEPAYPPPDFTYIHVRQAGGMTMKFLTLHFLASPVGEGYEKHERLIVKTNEIIEKHSVERFMQKLQSIAHATRFYTLVRNPISKFLSGMGQLMTRPQSLAKLNCSEDLKTAPAPIALRCVIDALKAGNRVDEHLCLQSHELYQALAGVNVSVALLPLEKLDEFMSSLGVSPFRMNVTNDPRKSRFKNTNLLDEGMIGDLCQIYAADVHMFRSVGMRVPECEMIVPWKPFLQ